MAYEQMSLFDTHIVKEFVTNPHVGGADLIAESFGITGGYVNRVVDVDVPNDWQVMYITGQSGCGKSTLASEIATMLCADTSPMSSEMRTVPLFMAWGDDQQSNLRTLSSVGLSDATLWLNTYEHLSDSQQARFEIADMMRTKNVMVVDEFLSTLDRHTAKPVAFSIQRACRHECKRLVAVTAHDDLDEWLMPDVVIRGTAFPSRWSVECPTWDMENPIVAKLVMWYGTKDEYRNLQLGELHYKGKYVGGAKEYLFASYDGATIGVLVSTFNMHTGGRRISRLVVHPSWRGCGVAKSLVRRYIDDFPNTDVVAAMALYNPVFERAGMARVADTHIDPPKGLIATLGKLGFDTSRWHDKVYLRAFCEADEARDALAEYAKQATIHICPGGKYLPVEEVRKKIFGDAQTAARVLFAFRPRTMAKYESGSRCNP